MPSHFLLYAGCTQNPGRLLGNALGIPHGRRADMPDERFDYVIRYGCRARIRYIPTVRTLNKMSAIGANTNKYNSLQLMQAAGIPVPSFNTTPEGLDYPMLGRVSNHMRGRGITLFLQPNDVQFMEHQSTHYMEYVPKEKEWRVHVVNGRILCILEKVPQSEEYNQLTCSHTGWLYRSLMESDPRLAIAISAIEAIGLDFGAVDIILSTDGQVYVLEVNTAPGFFEETMTLRLYAEAFRNWINIPVREGENNA